MRPSSRTRLTIRTSSRGETPMSNLFPSSMCRGWWIWDDWSFDEITPAGSSSFSHSAEFFLPLWDAFVFIITTMSFVRRNSISTKHHYSFVWTQLLSPGRPFYGALCEDEGKPSVWKMSFFAALLWSLFTRCNGPMLEADYSRVGGVKSVLVRRPKPLLWHLLVFSPLKSAKHISYCIPNPGYNPTTLI